MANYLFTVWPFAGHYFPQIALANELQQRGHHCLFYSGRTAGEVIEAAGFTFTPFKHVDEESLFTLMANRGQTGMQRLRQLQKTMQSWLVETIPGQVADLEPILDTFQPDVICCDPTLWGPILIIQQQQNIPVAVCSFVPACMLPGPDAPPFGLGLVNRKGLLGQTIKGLSKFISERSSAQFRDAVDNLLNQYGLPPLEISVTEYTGRMPLYLVPSAPEFDYNRHDLPPSVHYIGPCLWNKPSTNNFVWRNNVRKDQPWILVSEGTQHIDRPLLLQPVVQGFAELPLQIIATSGDRDIENSGIVTEHLPNNIHLERWIPHVELLPNIDVVVTTGGAGTILAALQHGVPLVVVPTEWDKPENAQRVVAVGAGIQLAPRRCTPKRLRQAVETVLQVPSYRENARRMADVFSRQGGAAQGATLLEVLASDKRPFPATVMGKDA